MGCFCVCSAQVQEVAKNSLRGVPESVVMSYSYFVELPRLEDIEPGAHTDVLIANSRVDQGRIRAAVEAVFDAHPALGTVFEPRVDTLTSRPGGGGWGWGVEPRSRRRGGDRTAQRELRYVHRQVVRGFSAPRKSRPASTYRQPPLRGRCLVADRGRRPGEAIRRECAGASTVGILVSAAGRRAGLPTEG